MEWGNRRAGATGGQAPRVPSGPASCQPKHTTHLKYLTPGTRGSSVATASSTRVTLVLQGQSSQQATFAQQSTGQYPMPLRMYHSALE